MKTHWEKENAEGRCYFVSITVNSIVVGESHRADPRTEAAGSCSYDEFLTEKRFQDLILTHFDRHTLEAVIDSVLRADQIPELAAGRERINKIRKALETIPQDLSLLELFRDPGLQEASAFYGNGGFDQGYVTRIAGDAFVFEVKKDRGVLKSQRDENLNIPVALKGNCEGGVSFADHFFLKCSQNFCVVSPNGEIIFDTQHLKDFDWGSTLRIGDIYLARSTVFFRYQWFDPMDGKPGLVRYDVGKGFVGRREII